MSDDFEARKARRTVWIEQCFFGLGFLLVLYSLFFNQRLLVPFTALGFIVAGISLRLLLISMGELSSPEFVRANRVMTVIFFIAGFWFCIAGITVSDAIFAVLGFAILVFTTFHFLHGNKTEKTKEKLQDSQEEI